MLTRAFVLAPGAKIRAEDLDLGARRAPAPRARSRRDFETDEKDRILAALRAARWNVSVVSRTLGIPRNTLYRKLSRYRSRTGRLTNARSWCNLSAQSCTTNLALS